MNVMSEGVPSGEIVQLADNKSSMTERYGQSFRKSFDNSGRYGSHNVGEMGAIPYDKKKVKELMKKESAQDVRYVEWKNEDEESGEFGKYEHRLVISVPKKDEQGKVVFGEKEYKVFKMGDKDKWEQEYPTEKNMVESLSEYGDEFKKNLELTQAYGKGNLGEMGDDVPHKSKAVKKFMEKEGGTRVKFVQFHKGERGSKDIRDVDHRMVLYGEKDKNGNLVDDRSKMRVYRRDLESKKWVREYSSELDESKRKKKITYTEKLNQEKARQSIASETSTDVGDNADLDSDAKEDKGTKGVQDSEDGEKKTSKEKKKIGELRKEFIEQVSDNEEYKEFFEQEEKLRTARKKKSEQIKSGEYEDDDNERTTIRKYQTALFQYNALLSKFGGNIDPEKYPDFGKLNDEIQALSAEINKAIDGIEEAKTEEEESISLGAWNSTLTTVRNKLNKRARLFFTAKLAEMGSRQPVEIGESVQPQETDTEQGQAEVLEPPALKEDNQEQIDALLDELQEYIETPKGDQGSNEDEEVATENTDDVVEEAEPETFGAVETADEDTQTSRGESVNDEQSVEQPEKEGNNTSEVLDENEEMLQFIQSLHQ